MKYYIDDSFENFKPWSGAVYTFNRIISEGKADEAEAYFDEIAPADGWTDTGINDALWFDSDAIFSALGMKPDETHTRTASEILEAWQGDGHDDARAASVEIGADVVRIRYTLDEGDGAEADEEKTLDAEDVAALFGDDRGEIDEDGQTVETWEE